MAMAEKPPPPEQWQAMVIALLLGIVAAYYTLLGVEVKAWYDIWQEMFYGN